MIEQNINISKFNHKSGSSYIKLPKGLNYFRKGLINIQNTDDSKSLKWCLVRFSQIDLGRLHINLVVKSKLPPCSGSVSLRQLNLINKKGPQRFFKVLRYLHPVDKNPARIGKIDKDFAKVRDIHKVEKKNCISISLFGYENRE